MSNYGHSQPCSEDQLRQAANTLDISIDHLTERLEVKDSVRASFASSSGGPLQDQRLSHGAVRRHHQADRRSAVTFNHRDFDDYSIQIPTPEPFVSYEQTGIGYHEHHCYNVPSQAHQSFTDGLDVDSLGMPVPGFLRGGTRPAVIPRYQSHSNISVASLSGITQLPNLAPREPRQTKRIRETDVGDQDRIPRSRAPFRDQQTRESTALIRFPKRCIRCRMQRTKVSFFKYVHLDLSMT